MDYIEAIKNRRSVRTFDKNKGMEESLLNVIKEFMNNQNNPFGINIEWKLLDASEYNLSSPVIVGEKYYIAGKLKKNELAEIAFGYEFEEIILYLTSIGIGTTWIAGTMQRNIFEKAMELKEDELMPCVSPIGYPSNKLSLREKLMRKGIKADSRLDFNNLFFKNNFNDNLDKEELDKYEDILNLVRIAPSAVNKQPWRILIDKNLIHFYKKPSLKNDRGFDVQKIDIGIAMNHFVQGLKNKKMDYEFINSNPNIVIDDLEYIYTIKIK